MSLIAYLDEAGDHSLDKDDPDFPVFVLVMFVCHKDEYIGNLVPAVYRLKMDYFGHEGVILHSRDIRRAQGDFMFLRDANARQPFYDRINAIMSDQAYALIAAVIRKQEHKNRYGRAAENPYDLALTFAMESLLPLLEQAKQPECLIVAEARGKNEDDQLHHSFLKIIAGGTDYIRAMRFKKVDFKLQFLPKKMNIVGTQLADLAAYPIARHVVDPDKPNPAYDVVKDKFYSGSGRVRGLKVFP